MGHRAGANFAYSRSNQENKMRNSRMYIPGILNVQVHFSVLNRREDHWRYHRFFARNEASRMSGYKFRSLANPFELRDFIGAQLCHMINDSNPPRQHLGADSLILK